DEPKPVLMKRFKLNDRQAEAILEMRLRALRKLDELSVRKEHESLTAEAKDLRALLKDSTKRWKAIADEIAGIKKRFGPMTDLGRRRTKIGAPPVAIEVPVDALVAREPVTVLCSEKGWIRAAKGHLGADADLRYKEGDQARFAISCWSTDKLVVFGTNGRFYTLGVDKLPAARGHGEPVRLMIDLANDQDIVALFLHKPGRKLVVAAKDGRGFVVAEDDVIAQTRGGKQVLNLGEGVAAAVCVPAEGDHLAVLGENRKLIVFPLSELPEMARGRGVILQKYKDGGLSDVRAFNLAEGLTWSLGDRTRTETDLRAWIGKRAQTGRLPPTGFPKSNRF
ncbi:MAG: DNA gyrase C-terminal beta-propeller domain-containing protein, partial [Alphaproteobacteria bacterium]